MLIDLHTHTHPSSDDSLLSPTELVLKAKAAGLDGVCFTEHDWFWKPEELARVSRDNNFLVIPGVELNTEEGHLLVFGLTKYIFGMHHARVVNEMLNGNGAMVVAVASALLAAGAEPSALTVAADPGPGRDPPQAGAV